MRGTCEVLDFDLSGYFARCRTYNEHGPIYLTTTQAFDELYHGPIYLATTQAFDDYISHSIAVP